MEKEKAKKYFIVAICSLTLVVDNTLLTAILPILPEYFYIEAKNDVNIGIPINNASNSESSELFGYSNCTTGTFLLSENVYFGILVASKPTVQFIASTLVGSVVDKCGYDVPMFLGFGITIASSLVFGYGVTYPVLFIARAFQGIGSAFLDVASFAMVADMYDDDPEQRTKMIGLVLSGYAFGVLIGPPFGSFAYVAAGKAAPFVIIAAVAAVLSIAYFFSHKITKGLPSAASKGKDQTHIKMLLTDPYIMLCALATGIAMLAVGVLETGQPLWMMKTMCPKKWMLGVAFLPESLTYMVVLWIFPFILPNSKRWFALSVGMAMLGASTILLPFSTNVWMLFGPGTIFGIGFVAVDYSVLPILSDLVDKRHLPGMYGRVYAIMEFSFCLAYAVGPLLTATLVPVIGYKALMISTGVLTFICFPIGIYLKDPPSRDQATLQRLLNHDGP